MTLINYILFLFTAFATLSVAHSWVEEYQVISQNGTYVGDRGYSRGYVPRSMFPTLGDGDKSMNYELPTAIDQTRLRINASDPLCKASQRTSNYSNPAYPKLSVSPGDYVAMKYLENGHVTLPWTLAGKPELGGTVFIYGTTKPSQDEKLVDVLKWTKDGKGGDGRGFLMSAQSFDDGRCHQVNSCILSAERQILYPNRVPGQTSGPGQEQWCESDVQIPASQAIGLLTVYWVWQWTTGTMADCNFFGGKDEYYTTCADFDVIDVKKQSQKLNAASNQNTVVQENVQTAAVSNWASRTALTASPVIILATTTPGAAAGLVEAAHSRNATFWSSCSSVASAAAAAVSAGIKPTPPPACPAGKWATGASFASISSSMMASLLRASHTSSGLTSTTSQSTASYSHSSSRNHTRTLTVSRFVTITQSIATRLSPSVASTTPSLSYSSNHSASVAGPSNVATSSTTMSIPASSATPSVAGNGIVFPILYTIGVSSSSPSFSEPATSIRPTGHATANTILGRNSTTWSNSGIARRCPRRCQ